MSAAINDLMTRKNNFIILGDFNLKASYVQPIYDFTRPYNIVQLIDIPTRGNNILDLIFVKIQSL